MAAADEDFLEFGFCGVDKSATLGEWSEALAAPQDQASTRVRFVAAFQLAYQGFPDKPTPAYEKGQPDAGRRYEGLVYPAWYEIREYVEKLPKGTAFSFHLNETSRCPYVSSLLRGEDECLNLVKDLVEKFNARHIQVNLTAGGVPTSLFDCNSPEAEKSASVLRKLCVDFPCTIFIVPFAEIRKSSSDSGEAPETINTMPFFMKLLDTTPIPHNLCGFFDSSAGMGKEPDSAAQIPSGYPSGLQHFVGYTGGINDENVKRWLERYSIRAREHNCRLISDAQSGFRLERNRGKPVDVSAMLQLSQAVKAWAKEDAEGQRRKAQKQNECHCVVM